MRALGRRQITAIVERSGRVEQCRDAFSTDGTNGYVDAFAGVLGLGYVPRVLSRLNGWKVHGHAFAPSRGSPRERAGGASRADLFRWCVLPFPNGDDSVENCRALISLPTLRDSTSNWRSFRGSGQPRQPNAMHQSIGSTRAINRLDDLFAGDALVPGIKEVMLM